MKRKYMERENIMYVQGKRGGLYVIYQSLGNLYLTSDKNYASYISNEREIYKMSDFNSFDEVADYVEKYF